MLKKILIVLVLAVAGVLLYAATKPDTFQVQRRATIAAPPERVFALIDDFHRWGEWSPWEKLDPAMTRTFEGPASGTGAVYAWKGNKDVGQGRMEITESTPPGRIAIKLDFIEPMESDNVTEFVLAPKDGGTEVTWTMRGPSPYLTKVMDTVVGMDRLIGKDFEAGLANMKAAAER
ncbi:MAG: SRPBCC family protein [Xanthomonadales bacterium]|nr:SRPBCC family protein [Xanthomonadales bacterium]